MSAAVPSKREQENPSAGNDKKVKVVAKSDGSVEITSTNGKVKKRKGFSEEQFQEELGKFEKSGPRINEQNWLISAYEKDMETYRNLSEQEDKLNRLTVFDVTQKLNRTQLINTAENQYYHRNYAKCVEICETFLKLVAEFCANPEAQKANKREIEEVSSIRDAAARKLST